MSVLVHVKMDVAANDENFGKVVQEAFPEEYVSRVLELPTLQWKIWGVDPQKRQGSGFYLFATREAAKLYAKEVVFVLQQRPGIFNVTAQIWSISEEKTRKTKGPIDVPQIKDLKE
jgi:hypothetical protein